MARPVEYDRGTVLDQAMQTFWDKGFEATSMSDLVEATQLKPGSLYGAFQSKEALFLTALDRYGDRSVSSVQGTLAGSRSPLAGIRKCFAGIAGEVADPHGNHGCFLVNSVLELSARNEKIRARVNHHLNAIEALFTEALERARKAGEISPEKNPKKLAAFLMTNIWGLRVLGETAPSAPRVRAVVDQILGVLE